MQPLELLDTCLGFLYAVVKPRIFLSTCQLESRIEGCNQLFFLVRAVDL